MEYNVKGLEMCHCNHCEIELAGVECLTLNLANSREGKILQKRQRWGDFAWSDTNRFEQFYGPDANNFWHGPYQAKEVAIPFIEHQNAYGLETFTQDDARLLVFLNVVHDIQEAHTGDISLPNKTQESDDQETDIQNEILSRLFHMPQDDPFLQRLSEVQKGRGFLSRAFKAIEYAGYMRTGLRAWAGKDNEALESDERHQCYELGHAVLTKNTPRAQQLSVEFPYLADLLQKNQWAIDEANRGA